MSQNNSWLVILLAIIGIVLIITGIALWFLMPLMFTLAMVLLITGLVFLIIVFAWYLCRGRVEPRPTPKPKAAVEEVEVKTVEPAAGPEEFVPAVMYPSPGKKQLPIETVEGIGKAYGEKLRKGGIEWVEDLAHADPATVSRLCDVSDMIAKKWIAMARLTWLDDVSEEDAETIVLGASITSIEQLADADPEDLYNKVSTAEKFGRVQVPEGYSITKSKVQKWIASAKKEMTE
jgi:predicted flap endonuclease-1-like 5' DNA nuclease